MHLHTRLTDLQHTPAFIAPRRRLVMSALCAVVAPAALAQQAGFEKPSDFEAIQRRGHLTVAVYRDNEPYSFGPPADMRGLDVDIARALARALGLGLSLLPFHAGEDMNADLRHMVTRGHYLGYGPADLMMRVPVDGHLMAANPMASIFGAYQREVPVIVTNRHRIPKPMTAHDLAGHTLGGEHGTGLTAVLLGYGGGIFRERVRLYDTGLLAVQAVISGEVSAAYVTRAQAEYVIGRQTSALDAVVMSEIAFGNIFDRGWVVGVAVRSQNQRLRQVVDDAMHKLHVSGQIQSIFRQYHLTPTAI